MSERYSDSRRRAAQHIQDQINKNAGFEQIGNGESVWNVGKLWSLAQDIQIELPHTTEEAELIFNSDISINPEAQDQRREQAENMAWALNTYERYRSKSGIYEHTHMPPINGCEEEVIFQPCLGGVLTEMMEGRVVEIKNYPSS